MELVIDRTETIEELSIFLKIYKLHNCYLVLISDHKEMGIGNVTLASPPMVEGMKSTSASSHIFGVDKKLISTIISEKVSNYLKSPILLLLFIKKSVVEQELIKSLMKFINDALTDISNI